MVWHVVEPGDPIIRYPLLRLTHTQMFRVLRWYQQNAVLESQASWSLYTVVLAGGTLQAMNYNHIWIRSQFYQEWIAVPSRIEEAWCNHLPPRSWLVSSNGWYSITWCQSQLVTAERQSYISPGERQPKLFFHVSTKLALESWTTEASWFATEVILSTWLWRVSPEVDTHWQGLTLNAKIHTPRAHVHGFIQRCLPQIPLSLIFLPSSFSVPDQQTKPFTTAQELTHTQSGIFWILRTKFATHSSGRWEDLTSLLFLGPTWVAHTNRIQEFLPSADHTDPLEVHTWAEKMVSEQLKWMTWVSGPFSHTPYCVLGPAPELPFPSYHVLWLVYLQGSSSCKVIWCPIVNFRVSLRAQ